MANIDGLPVNSAVTHAEFISRTENSGTVAKLSLQDADVVSGASVSNIQRAINKSFEGVGATGESDTTVNDYSSNNYIVDGDNRKVAIEKIDTQLFTTQADLDTAEATIAGHETRLDTIETLASTFGGDKEFSDNVIVQGNLTVNGTQTILNTATVDSEDPNVTINKNGNDALSEGAGFTVDRTGTKGSLQYQNSLASKFKIGDLASEQEIVTVGHAQTLTNKTLTDAQINALVAIEQGSTPATPASGKRKLYSKADGFYQLDSTGLESKVGSGSGSGGVTNLIVNGSADDAVSSIFTPYADAAASRPIDGTGGSPTVTTSLSSTVPLTGTKSFILSKTAANSQGQGWAATFSVDPSYRAKSLKISGDYIVSSGTFAAGTSSTDGDVIWYLYDITNSQLIEPSNIKMFSSSTTISDSFQATFQTSVTGSSYRLIAHVASTSALAFDLKVDNVTVSPQVYVYGSPVTDEVAYTPTFTGFGTATSIDFTIGRIGDKAIIRGKFTSGTSTAVEARMSIPYTVDSTKISALKVVGKGNSNINAGTNFGGIAILAEPSTQYLTFGSETSTSNGITKSNGNTLVSSGNIISFEAIVPIQGWSSSVQMSDNSSTRLISATYVVTTGASTTANTPINFETKILDTLAAVTIGVGSWKFTAPTSGLYKVFGSLSIGSTPNLRIWKNGVAQWYLVSITATIVIPFSTEIYLNAGDYIDVRPDATGTTTGGTAGTYQGVINIDMSQGPQAIAASESVNCRYTNTAGTSIANTGVDIVVPFATKDYDSHGAFVTDTFTAPIAGKYDVTATIAFASSLYAAGNQFFASVYKNGSIHSYGIFETIMAALTINVGAVVSTTVNCVAGDTIVVRVFNNRTTGSTALLTTTGANHLEIKRVGN